MPAWARYTLALLIAGATGYVVVHRAVRRQEAAQAADGARQCEACWMKAVESRDPAEREAGARKTVELAGDIDDARLLTFKGRALELLADDAGAERAFTRAIELDPTFRPAIEALDALRKRTKP